MYCGTWNFYLSATSTSWVLGATNKSISDDVNNFFRNSFAPRMSFSLITNTPLFDKITVPLQNRFISRWIVMMNAPERSLYICNTVCFGKFQHTPATLLWSVRHLWQDCCLVIRVPPSASCTNFEPETKVNKNFKSLCNNRHQNCKAMTSWRHFMSIWNQGVFLWGCVLWVCVLWSVRHLWSNCHLTLRLPPSRSWIDFKTETKENKKYSILWNYRHQNCKVMNVIRHIVNIWK